VIFFVVALFVIVLVQWEWIRKCRGWMGEAEVEVLALRAQVFPWGFPVGSQEELDEARRRVNEWSRPRRPF
jgi:hypothetical protein